MVMVSPNKFLRRKISLNNYCTLIMFTGSAQHASNNFGQYSIYGFVPNAPLTLRLPPPSKKEVADYSVLLHSLPDKKDTAAQVAVVDMLSQYSQDEVCSSIKESMKQIIGVGMVITKKLP